MCGNNLPDDPSVVWVVLAHESAHVMQSCNGGNLMPAALLTKNMAEARRLEPDTFHELQLYHTSQHHVEAEARLVQASAAQTRWWPCLKNTAPSDCPLEAADAGPWLMVVDKPAGLLTQPGLGPDQQRLGDHPIAAQGARICDWFTAWIATPRVCCCWPGVPMPYGGSVPCLPNVGSTSSTVADVEGELHGRGCIASPFGATVTPSAALRQPSRGTSGVNPLESLRCLSPTARGSGCARSRGAPISCGPIWPNSDTPSLVIPSMGMPIVRPACICMPRP